MSEDVQETPHPRGIDWVPWAIFAILALALIAIVWLTHRTQPELALRTAKTGWPLTPEQKSVNFETADLTFEIHPEHRRIDGQATLGFLVKSADPQAPVRS